MPKISEDTFKEMKQIVADYENGLLNKGDDEQPYLETIKIKRSLKFNPKYPSDATCECGHSYHRHFDSYEDNDAVGCKYCQCNHFVKAKPKE